MSPTSQVSQLGSIMGVWAHPDDESFTSAGLFALAINNKQQVVCITATKGQLGLQDPNHWRLEDLGEVRAAELAAGLEILGIDKHHWLDYMDGCCRDISVEEGASKVLRYIEQYKPDTIVTFPPDGITGHDDHRSVSAWAKRAITQTARPIRLLYAVNTREQYDSYLKKADEKFNIFFNIDEPVLIAQSDCDLYVELPQEITAKKLAALKAMPSQTGGMFNDPDNGWLEGALCCEAFVDSTREDIVWG